MAKLSKEESEQIQNRLMEIMKEGKQLAAKLNGGMSSKPEKEPSLLEKKGIIAAKQGDLKRTWQDVLDGLTAGKHLGQLAEVCAYIQPLVNGFIAKYADVEILSEDQVEAWPELYKAAEQFVQGGFILCGAAQAVSEDDKTAVHDKPLDKAGDTIH